MKRLAIVAMALVLPFSAMLIGCRHNFGCRGGSCGARRAVPTSTTVAPPVQPPPTYGGSLPPAGSGSYSGPSEGS